MKIFKKLIQRILPAALCLTLHTGFSLPAMAENAQSELSAGDAYGTAALSYLDTLVHTYPNRTNNENDRSQSVSDAGLWIRSQLEAMGYTVETQDYVHLNFTGTNYYVTRPGVSDDIVCLGAHYDCVDTAGADDNGSGVSVLLEIAGRFAQTETPCTLQFVFFDNEEQGGFVGSYNYVNYVLKENNLLDNVICYINLDSVGGGDRLYAYGGVYDENGSLEQIWPYLMAHSYAETLGISLYTMPKEVEMFQTPTRNSGSDHYYFMQEGIPYLYLEAGLWCDDDGGGGNDETHLTCHYQTADPAFSSSGGQIMHTEFDNLDTLNSLLPGRVQSNLSSVSRLVSAMLTDITPDTPPEYILPEETYAEETESEKFTEATEASSEEATEETEVLSGSHLPVLILLSFIGVMILAAIAFVLFVSSVGSRNRRRRRRFGRRRRKKSGRRKFN